MADRRRTERSRCNSQRKGFGGKLEKAEAGAWAGKGHCKNVAGKGTDHLGSGRCKLHGGNNRAGLAHPAWVHGKYAESVRCFLSPESREKFDEILTDPELLALRADIAIVNDQLLRALEVEHNSPDAMERLVHQRHIVLLQDHKRKLVTSERDRIVQLQQLVSYADLEGYQEFVVKSLYEAIERHVASLDERDAVLTMIGKGLKERGRIVQEQILGSS